MAAGRRRGPGPAGLGAAWDFGRAIAGRVGRDDVGAYAAALTYNLLFAVFPLGLALAGLLTWLHLPSLEQSLLRLLSGVLAPEVTALIAQTILGRAGLASPALVYGGIAGYLLGMSGAFRSLMDGFNHAYEYRSRLRPLWKTWGLSLLMALGLGVGLLGAAALIVSLQHGIGAAAQAAFGPAAVQAATFALRWLLLVVMALLALAAIFWLAPDRPRPFAWVSGGTLVALGAWLLTSIGFSVYLAHFNSYNRIYGSFGAAILLLLYLYFLSFSLLIGAEVDAELEQRRQHA